MKKINEHLLRKESEIQMNNLLKTIDAAGGDIGDKVSRSEKTKETSMPNAFHIDNPFKRKKKRISTYEDFTKTDNKKKTKAMNIFNEAVDENIVEGDTILIDEDILKSHKNIPQKDLDKIKNAIGEELTVITVVSENGDFEIEFPEGGKFILPKQYAIKVNKKVNESSDNFNILLNIKDYIQDHMSNVKIMNFNDIETIRKELILRFNIKDSIENIDAIDDMIKDYTDGSEYDETTEKPLRESKETKTSTKKDKSIFYTSFNDYFHKSVKKEYDEGKFRPMSPNIPDEETITSYNMLRNGQHITFDDVTGYINKVKGNYIYIDIIDDNEEHKIVKYPILDVIKKLKENK